MVRRQLHAVLILHIFLLPILALLTFTWMQTLKPSVVEDTIAFAKRLSLAEVGLRAAAEIGFNFLMVSIIRAAFHRLAKRAAKVGISCKSL